MVHLDDKINALQEFINEEKFSAIAWNNRGLNQSDEDTCDYLQETFNEVAEKLKLALIANKKNGHLKSILKASLKLFPKNNYDTEEREFICDTFNSLSKLVDVNFASALNNWLYGPLLPLLLRIKNSVNPEKIVYTLQQPCIKCGTDLETYIKKVEEGIPDTNWFIVKCNVCTELNLLTLEPNIKELKFGNYELIENLFKEKYSYEQAQIRLEQIKLYRK